MHGADYVIYDQSQQTTSDLPTLDYPTQKNKDIISTNLPKKDKSITDLSNIDSYPIHSNYPSPLMIEHTERKGKEAATQSAVEIYREIIKDNIEYNIMIHDNRFDTDRIVEILDLIFETVYTTRKKLRIVDEPISLVALANAIKAEQKGGKGKPKEEKQSIRAQLKKDAGKEKAATKKKNNDLEV